MAKHKVINCITVFLNKIVTCILTQVSPLLQVVPKTVTHSDILVCSGQMLTMLQPMQQQHGPGTPPLVQPANTHQQPIGSDS